MGVFHMVKLLPATIFSLVFVLAACADSSPIEWGYSGAGAPEHWASLSPDFAACANGKQQSPIDITGYVTGDLGRIAFTLEETEATLHNDGRQVRAEYEPGNRSTLEGREFHLKSAHFHSPSEHKVDGESFPAELHLVPADSAGDLAVVGVLFRIGEGSGVVESILKGAPDVEDTASARIDLADALPSDLSYYRYDGSKTTPPCDEPVDWYVLRQPMTVSQEQVEGLLALSGGPNNRPIQPIGDRIIRVGGLP